MRWLILIISLILTNCSMFLDSQTSKECKDHFVQLKKNLSVIGIDDPLAYSKTKIDSSIWLNCWRGKSEEEIVALMGEPYQNVVSPISNKRKIGYLVTPAIGTIINGEVVRRCTLFRFQLDAEKDSLEYIPGLFFEISREF